MFKHEITKGTVELIVLAQLEQRPMYGYEIIQRVHEQTDGAFEWREASLYPALYRMEDRKWIAGEWREDPGTRRRKYYRLAPAGKRALASQRKEWISVSRLVTQLAAAH